MDKTRFNRWLEGYLKAWTSNDPEDIAALFTPEAKYTTQAFREPWDGRETIIASWLERDDQPGTWTFEHQWLAVEGDSGVLEGLTVYIERRESYANIWLIRLDAEGKCVVFKEWWVKEDG